MNPMDERLDVDIRGYHPSIPSCMLRIMDGIRATHRERAAPVGPFGTVVLAYLHD